jgi:PAT family beta-lactamase induction signal transducer AmpG
MNIFIRNVITHTQQIISKASSDKRLFTILLLGFSSGLPAALTASTLQAWFTEAGINLKTIGAVTLLVMPYSFRFLWAPFFDRYHLPGFDRRRGWLLLTQVMLAIAIAAMAFLTPQQMLKVGSIHVPWLIIVGFITAFISASQDIVINAYQIEILPVEEQGVGAALYVTGWRISVIISGALALVLAGQFGWHLTYLFMANLMAIGIIASWLGPPSFEQNQSPKTLLQATLEPFKDFFSRHGFKAAAGFLLLILTYKLGDALTLALNTTFLLREMGFDLATLGLVNKTISLISALLGGLLAGIYIKKISLYSALLIFGIIQAIAHLGYAFMAYWGKSFMLLVFTAFTENFCSAMGTIALLALLMALCNIKYTATQFALLSAIAFIARTFVGPATAVMIDRFGWLQFFVWCFVLSLPTLLFVRLNKKVILRLRENT